MRQRTLGLLIVVVALMGLAACGDDDAGPDAAPRTTDAASAGPEASDQGATGADAGTDGSAAPDGAEGRAGTASATDAGEDPASPPPTSPVDADKAAAATANARLLYSDVLPEGAMDDVIDRLLATACPIAADESLAPAEAAEAVVDVVPTDAGLPRSVPALIMVVGRYVVDGGCGTSPHLDLVADELHAQLGTAMAEHR